MTPFSLLLVQNTVKSEWTLSTLVYTVIAKAPISVIWKIPTDLYCLLTKILFSSLTILIYKVQCCKCENLSRAKCLLLSFVTTSNDILTILNLDLPDQVSSQSLHYCRSQSIIFQEKKLLVSVWLMKGSWAGSDPGKGCLLTILHSSH